MGSGPLPSMHIRVEIEDSKLTTDDLKRRLEALGEAYSRSWSYDNDRRDQDEEFFSIISRFRVPASMAMELGYGTEKIEIFSRAMLMPEDVGFSAEISQETTFLDSDDSQDDFVTLETIRSYPCAHVPVLEDW